MLALVGFDDQNPGTEVHQLDVAARKAYELFDCLEICIRNMARYVKFPFHLAKKTRCWIVLRIRYLPLQAYYNR